LLRNLRKLSAQPPLIQARSFAANIDDKEMDMTKLEAIVQPNKFDAVKSALVEIGIDGMTVSEVRGHGRQKGHTETYHGHEYSVDLLPKIKIEIVTEDKLVDQIVDAIIKNAATGKIGDGKIFVSKVEEAIRIRNQERGAAAL
jgi:nitrogen regulatory protein P-II 1